MAALSARPEPRLRGSLHPRQGSLSAGASREGGAAGLHLGVLPSLLRRHSLSSPGYQPGHRAAGGAPQRRAGARGEPRAHGVLRIPPMVNRVIVGAHYGMGSWLAQRVTAVIMAVYTLILGFVLIEEGPFDYAEWQELFANGWMRVATLLFAASLAWHAWVGMRDIWMDYVKPDGLRLALQVLTVLLLACYLRSAGQGLWR